MSVEAQVWMASKEVAERLDLHVRTLRNWLEMFVPATERQKNLQGHYLISEQGLQLLKTVKERKDAGIASLRDIQRQMIDEGLISLDKLAEPETASTAEPCQGQGLKELELTVNEVLFQFQQELGQLSMMRQMQQNILQKIAAVEEMQESLRLELRQVTFELDLMQQQLTRRKQRRERHQSNWSLNPLRWFSNKNNHAYPHQ